MGKTYINGELVSSSTNYAAAIEYIDKNNNKTTVQDGLDNLTENMGGLRFGINGDGNYGYYKADDSFVPFKQTSVYYLGEGTSFNIQTLLPQVDYTKLSKDNFLVTYPTSKLVYNTGGSNLNPNWSGHPAYAQWRAPSIKFNNSNGTLSITSGEAYGYVAGGASWGSTAAPVPKVYLIYGNIEYI